MVEDMRKRPTRRPEAAVITPEDASAANAARVVPVGAKIAKLGDVVLGYRHKSKVSRKQLPQHGFRDKRLAEVLRLLRLRADDRERMRAWTGSPLYERLTPETDANLECDELQAITAAGSVLNDPDDLQAWADKHLQRPRTGLVAWFMEMFRKERNAGNARPIPLNAKEAGDFMKLALRERAQAEITTMRPWQMTDEQFEGYQRDLAACREFNKREARKKERASAKARRGRPPKYANEKEKLAALAEMARKRRAAKAAERRREKDVPPKEEVSPK
ncbi:MAG: hypothetical protein U1E62_21485 [Alsobacter sp.]